MPTTYEPIQTYTLGSAASSITFSSIPATYTDLRLVIGFTTDTANPIRARYNGDTGTNYSRTMLSGDGSTATSSRSTGSTFIGITNGSDDVTPMFATADVFSYAGSTFKTSLGTESRDQNGAGTVGQFVNLWSNTAAITTILLYPASGNLKIGTTATLYGIKNA